MLLKAFGGSIIDESKIPCDWFFGPPESSDASQEDVEVTPEKAGKMLEVESASFECFQGWVGDEAFATPGRLCSKEEFQAYLKQATASKTS